MKPSNTAGVDALSPPRRTWQLGLLVLILAVAGMSGVISNRFVDWDDSITLYANPLMNPPSARTLQVYWTTPEHGLYIPGTYTLWALLASVAQTDEADLAGVRLDPRVFHAASLLLHAAASLVMFLLLRRLLLARETDADNAPSGWNSRDIAAAIGAALFALHPVQVESVAWASGMKDLLGGLFALLALWQYVIAVQADSRRAQMLHFALASAAFVWAMLCKPSAMVVPALACAIDLIVLRRHWRQVAWWTAPWWPMALACAVVARLVQTTHEVPVTAIWLRPLVALDALAFYVGKVLLPLQFGMDYGRTPTLAQERGWLYVTWLVPIALAAGLAWKPRRALIAAAILTLLCLLPMLGLTPFMFQLYSTVSDHYLYLAMIGPALALAWATRHYRLARPVAMLAIALLTVQTIRQVRTWHDDLTLFSHALEINPDSFMARNNLANAHCAEGDIFAAAAHIADRAGDNSAATEYRGRSDDEYAQAIGLYEASIAKRRQANRGSDDMAILHENLAIVCSRAARHEQALAQRLEAAKLLQGSRSPDLRRKLPALYVLAGDDLLTLNRPQQALHYFEEAHRLDPADTRADEAIARARRAIAAVPID